MTDGPVLLFEAVKVLAALAVVLALSYLVLRFGLPRLLGYRGRDGTGIEVLGVRPLDRQYKLAVIEAEGRRLLIAFGPGGIVPLTSREIDAAPPPPSAEAEEKAP